MKDSFSIILPTYNEVENIAPMVKWIDKELRGFNYEILVVDDNSPDGTGGKVLELKEDYPQLKLITRTKNPGLVPAICEGIRESNTNICIWMDSDLTMSPELIPIFISELSNGHDLAMGSRYIPGGGMKGVNTEKDQTGVIEIISNLKSSEDSIVSAFISKFGNKLLRLILHPDIHDYSSGYFCAKKSFLLENMPSGTFVDYCLSLPFYALMKGYKVKEVPMVLATRKHGVSKTSETIGSILKIAAQCFSKAVIMRLKYCLSRRERVEEKLSNL